MRLILFFYEIFWSIGMRKTATRLWNINFGECEKCVERNEQKKNREKLQNIDSKIIQAILRLKSAILLFKLNRQIE